MSMPYINIYSKIKRKQAFRQLQQMERQCVLHAGQEA